MKITRKINIWNWHLSTQNQILSRCLSRVWKKNESLYFRQNNYINKTKAPKGGLSNVFNENMTIKKEKVD